jgi:RimJ/RimL family protein N-acetyltransferase
MLRVTGPGRAEVDPGDVTAEQLGAALDATFAAGTATVGWWVPVGDWDSRRTAWRLGFRYVGLLRGWLDGRDAWAFTLGRDDPRAPATRWLESPVIEGDGVRLRPFTDADVTRVVEGIGDADTQFWLAFMPREPLETDGQAYLEQVRERLATDHTVTWAFTAADDDRLLGAVGLFRLDYEPELGYWTHPDARGRRLTTRAAALAVDHAFDVLDLPVVSAFAAVGNTGSIRVLEGVGMRRVGVLRRIARTSDGQLTDLVGYDMLPEERASSRR